MTSDEWREQFKGAIDGTIVHAIIPSGITQIGHGSFNTCASLRDSNIPSSVTSINGLAFANCSNLTTFHIPSNVITLNSSGISAGVFSGCTGLVSIQLDEGLQTIGVSTFSSCSQLLKATIPDSVTSLAERVFGSCNAMQELTIGTGVASIGTYTFQMNSMRILTFKRVTPPSIMANAFTGSIRRDLVIYVPSQSVDAYKSALSFNATLQGKVTANPNE